MTGNTIHWYVIKDQSDGWHVDGYVEGWVEPIAPATPSEPIVEPSTPNDATKSDAEATKNDAIATKSNTDSNTNIATKSNANSNLGSGSGDEGSDYRITKNNTTITDNPIPIHQVEILNENLNSDLPKTGETNTMITVLEALFLIVCFSLGYWIEYLFKRHSKKNVRN